MKKEKEEKEREREEGEGVGRVAEVARAVAVHRPSLLGRGKLKIGRLPKPLTSLQPSEPDKGGSGEQERVSSSGAREAQLGFIITPFY